MYKLVLNLHIFHITNYLKVIMLPPIRMLTMSATMAELLTHAGKADEILKRIHLCRNTVENIAIEVAADE